MGAAMSRDVTHPVFSCVYPYIAGSTERGGGAEHRRRLLADLRGRVIEVGAGHGLNFGYYPVGCQNSIVCWWPAFWGAASS